MTQTAAAMSTGHALNIHEYSPAVILTAHTSSRPAVAPAKPAHTPSTDDAFYVPVSQLHYSDKVKLSFLINDTYQSHFVLIKGLLEFHRAPGYVFLFKRDEAAFEVTLPVVRLSYPLDEFADFLKKINIWLNQELSFKRQLKAMRAFELEYRAKRAKVYADGEGYTLRPLS
jgi:hypothetical protein